MSQISAFSDQSLNKLCVLFAILIRLIN
uniref:Uncharacterized protein n=1 Tax=Anguilla anguilla TaxID=7936 RepID=A0A0E9TW39_ANGAN